MIHINQSIAINVAPACLLEVRDTRNSLFCIVGVESILKNFETLLCRPVLF